jgi:hypothetical protein
LRSATASGCLVALASHSSQSTLIGVMQRQSPGMMLQDGINMVLLDQLVDYDMNIDLPRKPQYLLQTSSVLREGRVPVGRAGGR